jgi:hypothetical protein
MFESPVITSIATLDFLTHAIFLGFALIISVWLQFQITPQVIIFVLLTAVTNVEINHAVGLEFNFTLCCLASNTVLLKAYELIP